VKLLQFGAVCYHASRYKNPKFDP